MRSVPVYGRLPLLLLLLGFSTILAAAEPKPVSTAGPQGETGLGIIVGEPTGLTLKHWRNAREALAFAAAWSLSDNDSLVLNVDYLLHDTEVLRGQFDVVPSIYYGAGLHLKFREDNPNRPGNDAETFVGLRIPLGLSHRVAERRVELFGELVPVLNLIPDTELDLGLALGARYYFR